MLYNRHVGRLTVVRFIGVVLTRRLNTGPVSVYNVFIRLIDSHLTGHKRLRLTVLMIVSSVTFWQVRLMAITLIMTCIKIFLLVWNNLHLNGSFNIAVLATQISVSTITYRVYWTCFLASAAHGMLS